MIRLLAPLLLAAPATAADFTILIYETPRAIAVRADPGPAGQAYWARFATYGKALTDGGVLRGGAALAPAGRGAPSGYFQIAADSPAQARAWAAKAPAFGDGGRAVAVANVPMP